MSAEATEYVLRMLHATYTGEWERSMGGAPIADVKTVWHSALEPFTTNEVGKRRILWALKNLPDRPPNSRQFAALCRIAPMPETPTLPEPKADPELVRAELSKLGAIKTDIQSGDMRDWARRLIVRHEAGDRIRPISLRFARQALD